MAADVEKVLEKLGLDFKRESRSKLWTEWCPLPTHGPRNSKHRFANFFVRGNEHRYAGAYHCFSCKGGGKLVELVMLVKGLDFRSARDWLTGIGEEAPAVPVLRVRFDVPRVGELEVPGGVEAVGVPLDRWNSVPRRYLEGRGIPAEQVARWGLGYALMGKLSGRIFMPIRDAHGRLANYAARTFVDDPTRYKAAHESERPNISVMLGEHLWPDLAKRDTVVVFEGGFNGMALERALRVAAPGKSPELAGLQGSDALDPAKILKLSTFRRIVMATDPDKAGEKAAKSFEASLGRRTNFVRLRYPGGAQADSTPVDALAEELLRCLLA